MKGSGGLWQGQWRFLKGFVKEILLHEQSKASVVPREVSHRAQWQALIIVSEVSNQGRRKAVKRDQAKCVPPIVLEGNL